MKLFDNILFIIILILVLKVIVFVVNSIRTFDDEKTNFVMKVKRESIEKMTPLEFEGFCKWLFSTTNKYKSIDVPKIKSKDEISLILTTMDDEKIYVDCKRQSVKSSNELDTADDDETIVGKYVCERVVGSMALNNVKKGIIVTTGSIHQNALSYLDALRENTDYSISLVTMNEIVELLESQSLKDDYRITVTI